MGNLNSLHPGLRLGLAVSPFLVGFALDLIVPLGYSFWAFYLMSAMGVSRLFGGAALTWAVPAGVGLTLVGWIFSPYCCGVYAVGFNRAIGVVTMMVCGWMLGKLYADNDLLKRKCDDLRCELDSTLSRDKNMQDCILRQVNEPHEIEATIEVFRSMKHLDRGAERMAQAYGH